MWKPFLGGVLWGSSLILSLPFTKPVQPLYAAPSNAGLSKQSFVAEAVARSGPAVVTLETQRTVQSQSQQGFPQGLLIDPYFDGFFGRRGLRVPRSRVERNQGSGVIFSTEGLVITNAHVVEQVEKLVVGLSDGRRVSGRVVGQDSLTDLAVIQLNGSGPWPTVPLGDSEKLRVGDWAIAVGNPYGLENTVTLGIISNLNRNVSQLGIYGKRLDLIQTDAAINPGNSGGPLLNADGEIIGINTLVRSGPGAGLGFAIPINRAMNIAKQLVEKGIASHPMVGMGLSPIPSFRQDRGTPYGAVIRYLLKGGPAELAGLKEGDVILRVGKLPIKSPADVVNAINQNGVGRPLAFRVKRGKILREILVEPVEMRLFRRD